MKLEHLQELINIEKVYWWHVTKRSIVTGLLKRFKPAPAKLFEGGIGGGANLLFWKKTGYDVSGCDILPEAVRHCHSVGMNNVYVHNLNNEWNENSSSNDIVVLLDVLEHTKDPVTLLQNAAITLKKEGIIILTVPAIPWLIGPWDSMLGHYRRYSRRLLQNNVREAGLRIAWISYWNSFSLPGAIVARLMEKIIKKSRSAEFPRVGPLVNRILVFCGDIERSIMRVFPIPFGVSLVAVLMHRKDSGE